MNTPKAPAILAFSPDDMMLGAVWVNKGEELNPVVHESLLADRLQRLLDRCEVPQEVRRLAERQHLSPAGLYFDGDLDIDSAAINWVSAIFTTPALSLQGATVVEKIRIMDDNPEAREHLESELEDPEDALLEWVANATSPLSESD